MVVVSCLGLPEREVLALKIFKVKRKKQGQWSNFVAKVDVKNKRIFCRRCLSNVFCKKGALKYLVKLRRKHVYSSFCFF